MQQLVLPGMIGRGGKRKGAGRKPRGERPRSSHLERVRVTRHTPLLVTFRVQADIPDMRGRTTLNLLESVLMAVRSIEGFRVIHYALLANHVHLIVEADDNEMASRGMHSLLIRFAHAMNRSLGRTGAVLEERYHVRRLMNPQQAWNGLAYVLCNANKHGATWPQGLLLDPFSSASIFPGWSAEAQPQTRDVREQDVLCAPRSWLLTTGWKKHGPISPHFVPKIR